MTLPVLTAIAIIFIIWLNYEIHKTSKLAKNDEENYWNREKESNFSRRKDISNLNYLIISVENLPMADHPDETVNSYRDTIRKLSGKKAINLAGLTNTDLKFEYGTANLNQLTEYENNYITLVSILQKWAERLYNNGNITECICVLEYAVSCFTDVTKTYRLLAEVYKLQGTPDKINTLIDIISNAKVQDKDKLIHLLKTMII